MASDPIRRLRISAVAEQDIEAILEWTYEHFGEDSVFATKRSWNKR